MRPLKGVVIKRSVMLTIHLSSGAKVRVPRQKDLRLGDTVYVLYDYTRMVVRDLWTEDEYSLEESFGPEPMIETPPDTEEPWKWAMLSDPVPDVSL